jgi:hypothetical protein
MASWTGRARAAAVVAAAIALLGTACADDDRPGADAGLDAGRDAGPPGDGGGIDTGTDAGDFDAGPPPGEVVTAELCEGGDSASVAVAPDGSRVAYVTCTASGDSVAVQDLASGEVVELGPGASDFSVEFSPDSAFVLYGASGALHIRDAAAAAAAVRLSTGDVVETRFIEIAPSGETPYLAILYSSTEAAVTTIAARDLATLDTERVLMSSDRLESSLALVSNTGQNLFVGEDDGTGFVRYHKVSTSVAGIQTGLPFGPTDFGMIVTGLGNTHGVAHTSGGGLAFRILEDDSEINVLVPSGVDPAHPVLALAPAETTYLYFIVGGDVSRHERSATSGSLELLSTGAARSLAATPDGGRVLFASSTSLFSIAADGGSAVEVIPGLGTSANPDLVFSPGSDEVAALADGMLIRAPVDAAGAREVLDGPGVSQHAYSGDGARLLWLRDGSLHSAGASSGAETVSPADDWWPVPTAPDVLYRHRSTLRSLNL